MENLVIDQIEKKNYKNQTKCLFFPNQNSYQFYIQVLKQCKKILIVCMYQISHKKLVNILLQLSEKDIHIQLLVYCTSMDSRQMSILQGLLKNSLEKIKIAIFTSDQRLMHSKFCVIDDEIVLVGSANWTNYAFKKNHESVIMIENVQRAQEFRKQFQYIWNNCQLLNMRIMNFSLTPIVQIGQKRRNRQNKTLEKCTQMIESLIEIPPLCESFEEQKDSNDVECLQKFGSPIVTYIYKDQKDSTNKIKELLSKNLIQLINSDDECSVDKNYQENDIEILL